MVLGDMSVNLANQRCDFILIVRGDRLEQRLKPIRNWMAGSKFDVRFIFAEYGAPKMGLEFDKNSSCNNIHATHAEPGSNSDYLVTFIHASSRRQLGTWNIGELASGKFSEQINNLMKLVK